MSVNRSPHVLLHVNLTILQAAVPGERALADCVKEGMFEHPNRTGFENVIHYLLHTYDCKKTSEKLTWPIVDRRLDERKFRKEAVALVNDITKENPDSELPLFSPSFLTCPGGDRFIKFMWKLSLLVLKIVTERLGGEDIFVLERPTQGLHVVQNITKKNLLQIKKDMENLGMLLHDASEHAKNLCEEIILVTGECKKAHSELHDLVQSLDHYFFSDIEKAFLLDINTKEPYKKVIKDWTQWYESQVDVIKNIFQEIRKQSLPIVSCYDSVKALVSLHEKPIQLRAPDVPELFQETDGHLSLSNLFSETSAMLSKLFSVFSTCGGFTSSNHSVNQLISIHKDIQDLEMSFNRLNVKMHKLISGTQSKVGQQLGTIAGQNRLQVGYKMLGEATFPTPPLNFVSKSDIVHSVSISESPMASEVEGLVHSNKEKGRLGFIHAPRRILDADRFYSSQSKRETPISKKDHVTMSHTTISIESPSPSLFKPVAKSTVLRRPLQFKDQPIINSRSFNKNNTWQHFVFPRPKEVVSTTFLQQEKLAIEPKETNNMTHLRAGSGAQSLSQSYLLNFPAQRVCSTPSEEIHQNKLFTGVNAHELKVSETTSINLEPPDGDFACLLDRSFQSDVIKDLKPCQKIKHNFASDVSSGNGKLETVADFNDKELSRIVLNDSGSSKECLSYSESLTSQSYDKKLMNQAACMIDGSFANEKSLSERNVDHNAKGDSQIVSKSSNTEEICSLINRENIDEKIETGGCDQPEQSKPKAKRKSLMAIIDKYRQFLAQRDEAGSVISLEPAQDEKLDVSTTSDVEEDCDFYVDLNLDL